MTQHDEDPGLYEWLVAGACGAVGLFAIWIAVDSGIQFARREIPLSRMLTELGALPIGAGFLLAGLDVLRPAPRARADRALMPLFLVLLLFFISGTLVSGDFQWTFRWSSLVVPTLLIAFVVLWRRITEP
jgi:hypothetical protein